MHNENFSTGNNKLMRNMKNNSIRITLILLCSLLLAFCFERVYTNRGNIKSIISSIHNPTERIEVDLDELLYCDYNVENSFLYSLSDSSYIYQGNIKQYVTTVTIIFSNPIEMTTEIIVYFTPIQDTVSEERAIRKNIQSGTTRIVIDVFTNIDSLRYNIGNAPGQKFELSGILLNEYGVLRFLTTLSIVSAYRIGFLFCLFFFLLIHFIVNIAVFYDAAFKYRYVIAITIFLLLVTNKIHFSSVGMYDYYIQQGYGSEFVSPIFGTPRAIRSDEWVVSTPMKLASQYDPEPYGRSNYIVRGTRTENMPQGININFASLVFPLNLGYLFGAEYGVSFWWVGTLIIAFMVSFELMYIISLKNRLLAIVGACLVVFSPFFLWWSYASIITPGIGSIVCFYHFLKSDDKVKRLLFSLAFAIFFSQFIMTLYPAWQVPSGYLFLGLSIWILVDNWILVKKFTKIDWGIVFFTIIMTAVLTVKCLYESREYIIGIMNTIYPGARHMSGGGTNIGYAINRWMNAGVCAPISAFKAFAPTANTNVSEFGGFYTLFPIPILFLTVRLIKKKVFDLLSIILIFISLCLSSYIFLGWPDWLAQISLMSYSAPARTMDVVLFIQVFLLVIALSGHLAQEGDKKSRLRRVPQKTTKKASLKRQNIGHKKEIKQNTIFSPLITAFLASVFLLSITINFSKLNFTEGIKFWYYIILFIGFLLTAYSILNPNCSQIVFKTACVYLICFSCFIGLTIHPVMIGLDSIYSKPIAAKVRELATDTDEKWISLDPSIVGSSYLIACGASTINSVNAYPNLDLWYRLDPSHLFEHIYNRYAHVTVRLTDEDTTFDLGGADHIILNLSYNDLIVAGVRYIHSPKPLVSYEGITFHLLYNEGGSLIYSVCYDHCADCDSDIIALDKANWLRRDYISAYFDAILDKKFTVIMAVQDEASRSFDDMFNTIFNEIGLKENIQGKWRYGYAAIIDNGNVLYEQIASDPLDLVTQNLVIDGTIIEVESSGYDSLNKAVIKVNGIDYSLDRRGINIVVYDKDTRQVIDSVCLDTHAGLSITRRGSSIDYYVPVAIFK